MPSLPLAGPVLLLRRFDNGPERRGRLFSACPIASRKPRRIRITRERTSRRAFRLRRPCARL